MSTRDLPNPAAPAATDPTPDSSATAQVAVQLEEVSDAIQRAAADLLAARLVLDRERAEFAAKGASPTRALLISATRVVDELRQTDEALVDLLKELENRSASV